MKKFFTLAMFTCFVTALAIPAWAVSNNFSTVEECNTAVGKKEFSLYKPSILRGADKARAEAAKHSWKETPLSEGVSPVCVDMHVAVPNVVRRWAPMDPRTHVWRDGEGKVRAIVECGNIVYDARQTTPIASAPSAPATITAPIICNLSGGRTMTVAKTEDCRETVVAPPPPIRTVVYETMIDLTPRQIVQAPPQMYVQQAPAMGGFNGNTFVYSPNKSRVEANRSAYVYAPRVQQVLTVGGGGGSVTPNGINSRLNTR